MSKAAFGSSVPKFTNHGIHPKLKSYNNTSSTSVNIGPGSYDIKANENSSKNKFKSEIWKIQYHLEQQKRILHFMIKEQKEEEAEMKRRLGPGTYNSGASINYLSKSNYPTTILQSKNPRFKENLKDCYPSPCDYGIPQDSIDNAEKSRKYSNTVGLLDRGGNSTRLPFSPSFHIGPGIYNIKSSIDEIIHQKTGKRGYYDCNSIDRSLPIKTGHCAILVSHNLGPGQYSHSNEIDNLKDKYHNFKGRFLREKQYPDKPYQRVFWSDSGNTPADKTNQVSPASYDVIPVRVKTNSKVPFLSSDKRMNKTALNNFMGGNNPLTGPGRYNCDSSGIGESGNGYESVFKSLVPNVSDTRTIDILRHRVRPLNIPENKKHKFDHLTTENATSEHYNVYGNLKPLVLS